MHIPGTLFAPGRALVNMLANTTDCSSGHARSAGAAQLKQLKQLEQLGIAEPIGGGASEAEQGKSLRDTVDPWGVGELRLSHPPPLQLLT